MKYHHTLLLVAGVIVHVWTTDEGTLAFTDDPKRIPARYAEQARAFELQPLDDYARFTPLAATDKKDTE